MSHKEVQSGHALLIDAFLEDEGMASADTSRDASKEDILLDHPWLQHCIPPLHWSDSSSDMSVIQTCVLLHTIYHNHCTMDKTTFLAAFYGKSCNVAVGVIFSGHFSKQLQTTSRRTVRLNRPWGLRGWWKPPTTKVAIVLWYTTFSAGGYTQKLILTCRFSEAFFPHGDSSSSTN